MVTYADCDAALTLVGPLVALMGSVVLYVAFLAWFKPNANIVQDNLVNRYPSEQEAGPFLSDLGFTREFFGPINMFMFRLLGPLIGAVFLVVGLWVTISQIYCGGRFPDPRPLWGPLKWQHISFIFVIFAGLLGAWNARRIQQPVLRALCVLLIVLFGVAASEAAAFHAGIQADRWGAAAFLAAGSAGVVWFVSARATRRR